MSGLHSKVVGLCALALVSCSDPTAGDQCIDAGGIEVRAGTCLDMTRAGALSVEVRQSIEREVRTTLDLAGALLSLGSLQIVVDTDPSGVIPGVGVGGFAPNASRVTISFDVTRPDLDRIVREVFPPVLAHELHHTVRHATAGYGSTLVEAAVSEGLADHFSLEVFNSPVPPWAVALSGEALATWTDTLLNYGPGSYDHPRWFFGADGTVPPWTGYAVGFDLVRRFLESNPEARASQLVDQPAGTLLGS